MDNTRIIRAIATLAVLLAFVAVIVVARTVVGARIFTEVSVALARTFGLPS